ncbi:2-hydroxyacid dehydrogenase [Labedaea rhizosphaerae]|uniref:Phosphoglycerate dehydrogenase-like enzyme n=1 Tax=Labedaea rhizosphaerae TaxID=598644 RepID=A0A4R6SDV8_LABRH|nr:2-hydroxyacid dehydrogenase [Labedaea rhizosphaerae]TDP98072.1 phosphoglycerate dehydrogenase-like enzyme [Labedaea rhizosphaerae]
MTIRSNTTVLVPDEYGFDALTGVDGLTPVRYTPGEPWPEGAREAEVLVPGFLTPMNGLDLTELPNLKLVQLLTAGVESWVGRLPDGILLSSGRGAHGGSTAEWVLAALLAIYRELPQFGEDVKQARWDQHVTDTLWHKRILIVGAGDLAKELVRRLDAFDAYSTVVATKAREGVRGADELPALLPEHDAAVLVVPLTEATTGMVDADFLARMPDGAVLVNAARGPVVDTDALLAELKSGRLRAALDVTDPEPLPSDHPLWTAPGLLLTPHVAGSTRGHRDRAYAIAIAEIRRFVAGERPHNLVAGAY